MGRRRNRGFRSDDVLQGILLVDKPAGLTSHDVCQAARSALRVGKVGHGGTLDPFATGLLPLLVNGATRLMPLMQSRDKVYEALVRLGRRTDTMDPTGEVVEEKDASGLADENIREVVAAFVGKGTQVIPRYSAARVDGKHLYEYARAGEEVEQPTKEVEIHAIDDLVITRDGAFVDLSFSVHCGAGTYVRSLADDIGQRLGVGGYLEALRRTRTGTFGLAGAIKLDALVAQSDAWREERRARIDDGEQVPFEPSRNAKLWADWLGAALLPVTELLGDAPTVRLKDALVERVVSGTPLRKAELITLDGFEALRFEAGDRVVLEHPDGMRSLATARAKVGSEAAAGLPGDAVVLNVERLLR